MEGRDGAGQDKAGSAQQQHRRRHSSKKLLPKLNFLKVEDATELAILEAQDVISTTGHTPGNERKVSEKKSLQVQNSSQKKSRASRLLHASHASLLVFKSPIHP